MDLIVFIVIILLASKSCKYLFVFPSAVTLRLGSILKARPVPTLKQLLQIQAFSAEKTLQASSGWLYSVKNLDTLIDGHLMRIQSDNL